MGAPSTRSVRLRRVALSAATAFLAVNIWTGAPLFALWVGAKVVGQKQLTMQAVFVVVLVLGVLVLAISSSSCLQEPPRPASSLGEAPCSGNPRAEARLLTARLPMKQPPGHLRYHVTT